MKKQLQKTKIINRKKVSKVSRDKILKKIERIIKKHVHEDSWGIGQVPSYIVDDILNLIKENF